MIKIIILKSSKYHSVCSATTSVSTGMQPSNLYQELSRSPGLPQCRFSDTVLVHLIPKL